MRQHFDVLGYLFLALGALTLLAGLVAGCALGLGGGVVGSAEPGPEGAGVAALLAGMGVAVFLFIAALGVLHVATGYGLLRRTRWARPLGLVTGALSLLSFPLGTALGVYALWALTRPEAEEEFA
jgi:hypothetical protein